MAHKKGGGSVGKNRDSNSKRLGVKRFGGESVSEGEIIIRQKGSHYYPGIGVKQGNDFTIYSVAKGQVNFSRRHGRLTVSVNG